MILTSLFLASAGLHVDVLGEGFLRFEAGHSVAFAPTAELTVNAKGLLADSKGRAVLPHVRLTKAAFSVSMNGTVSVSGEKMGRLVLQRPNGEIGFPGEGNFGVIELAPTVTASFPFVSGGVMQGSLRRTDDPLSIVIAGNGLFRVLQADGSAAYTRNGDFRLDRNGRIVTCDGLPLEPSVTVPQGATCISVSEEGFVYAILADKTSTEQIGRIELTTFMNMGGLRPLTHGRYAETEESGDPVQVVPGQEGTGTLMGGYLEILPVPPNY